MRAFSTSGWVTAPPSRSWTTETSGFPSFVRHGHRRKRPKWGAGLRGAVALCLPSLKRVAQSSLTGKRLTENVPFLPSQNRKRNRDGWAIIQSRRVMPWTSSHIEFGALSHWSSRQNVGHASIIELLVD